MKCKPDDVEIAGVCMRKGLVVLKRDKDLQYDNFTLFDDIKVFDTLNNDKLIESFLKKGYSYDNEATLALPQIARELRNKGCLPFIYDLDIYHNE